MVDSGAAQAIKYYSRLVTLWRDAGPALVLRRQEIQKRREALLASRG